MEQAFKEEQVHVHQVVDQVLPVLHLDPRAQLGRRIQAQSFMAGRAGATLEQKVPWWPEHTRGGKVLFGPRQQETNITKDKMSEPKNSGGNSCMLTQQPGACVTRKLLTSSNHLKRSAPFAWLSSRCVTPQPIGPLAT